MAPPRALSVPPYIQQGQGVIGRVNKLHAMALCELKSNTSSESEAKSRRLWISDVEGYGCHVTAIALVVDFIPGWVHSAMDTHPFASLAHVRILLIPVGLIPQSLFEIYAAEIRTFDSLRLAEIPTDTRDGRGQRSIHSKPWQLLIQDPAARFLPSPLSKGNLHLSFPSHPPPLTHSQLSLVRPSHFPLAVIGIASCSQTDSLKSLHSQFNTALADIFPTSSTYPLVKNCFVFEETEGSINLDLNENLPGLVVVPHITNRKLHIGTLLGVLCSQILAEFEVLVSHLSLLQTTYVQVWTG